MARKRKTITAKFCSFIAFMFSNKTLNKIMCGMAFGLVSIGLVVSHQWLAVHANEHNAAFSGDTVKLVALMLIPVCIALLGLGTRKFKVGNGVANLSVGYDDAETPYEALPSEHTPSDPDSGC